MQNSNILSIVDKLDYSLEKLFKIHAGEFSEFYGGISEFETVYKSGKVTLIKFFSESKSDETPLLIVPSLINRWYILDLTEKTSFIKYLTKNRDCYLLDWGYPGSESSNFGLSHYYHKSINRALRIIKKQTGFSKVDLLGYCIGGTLGYMYACLEPNKIRKLILLTTPLNFDNSGILGSYAKDFPTDEYLNSMDYMPGWLLASSFNFIQPMGIIQKAEKFYKNYKSEKFTELFVSMESWISDYVNFPKKAYSELIEFLYKDNLLYKNEMVTDDGIRVDVSKRKADCLMLNSKFDHIAPSSTTVLPNEDKGKVNEKTFSTGHIGITVGKYGSQVKETINDFLLTKEEN